jgi:predicted transport protein
LNLEFVKSEFALDGLRIDSLAFDNDAKAFVIIEYKRDKNFSVIDQGYAYLSLLSNNPADFILEYNTIKDVPLKRDDIDWSQSKVIFIAPGFTKYQRAAINFRDLPFQLWEIKRFENDILLFEQVQKTKAKVNLSAFSTPADSTPAEIKKFIDYTEEYHMQRAEPEAIELYETLKARVIDMDDNVTIVSRRQVIGFRVNNNIFCDIVIQSKGLKIFVNLKSGELLDDQHIATDVSNVGHWGNGAYQIIMKDEENIDYIASLLKQSLNKNKDRV